MIDRGFMGASPDSVWQSLTEGTASRVPPANVEQQRRFLIQLLPLVSRSIQEDGLTLFYIHYWHPAFAAWRVSRKKVLVRYHPDDLSRVDVSANGRDYLEVPTSQQKLEPHAIAITDEPTGERRKAQWTRPPTATL
jgi:putative transposase